MLLERAIFDHSNDWTNLTHRTDDLGVTYQLVIDCKLQLYYMDWLIGYNLGLGNNLVDHLVSSTLASVFLDCHPTGCPHPNYSSDLFIIRIIQNHAKFHKNESLKY